MILGDPRIPLDEVERCLKDVLGDFLPCPPLRAAELGDRGGLYGALELLKMEDGARRLGDVDGNRKIK